MDERVLQRLEFNLVREKLAAQTTSPIGRELAMSLSPAVDVDAVRRRLVLTAEARDLLRLEPGFDYGGWHDIRPELRRLAQGGVLEAAQLNRAAENLAVTRLVKTFFKKRGSAYPALKQLADNLRPVPELEEEFVRCIRPPGEILDDASPLLAQTRRRLERLKSDIREVLDRFLRSPAWQKYLQDPIVTIREGRYVLPVKIEYRDKVKGLVHDQSASGATLFVEPFAVVEKGNEVRRLEAAERQEIERILMQLSAALGAVGEDVSESTEVLGRLDLILAQGRYSVALDAVPPVVVPFPCLELKRARHPLIGKAVPIDVDLGKTFDTLIVTGPNTGGKTVALKTVGLCVLMAQSGLEIPAAEGTTIGVFRNVFADIGDEQSVAENLSTFSSHLRNIIEIISNAGENSLVLLDELGAGTDPREGAALGCAVLEELGRRGAKTIASTHSGELKEFAVGRSRVENASVELDPETLSPTYRLITGQPGRSNAFEIARGLGLPEHLVLRAREYLTPEERHLRDKLGEVEQFRRRAEAEASLAARLKEEAEHLKAEYNAKVSEILHKKDKVLAEAREDAAAAVRKARREAEGIIKELREKIHEENRRQQEMALQKARERLSLLGERFHYSPPVPAAGAAAKGRVAAGETVFLPRFGQEGTVMAVSEEGTVSVQIGAFRVDVPLAAVQPAERRRRAGVVEVTAARAVRPTLDLRGQRVEEALINLERHLDAALLAGLHRVDVIHGFGTGALGSAVKEYLRSYPRVKSFRAGGQGEGGAGVTVVELG